MDQETGFYTKPLKAKPNRRAWFLNGDLVHIEIIDRATDTVSLWNFVQNRRMVTTFTEFKKKRKRAYSVREAAELLNFHKKTMPTLIKEGTIPAPVGQSPGGERGWRIRSYYSEDQIIEARRLLAQTHIGRRRKDGGTTNNKVPTEQELRVAMGDAMLVYVRDESGRYIPIFSETI